MNKILVSAPPMAKNAERFTGVAKSLGFELIPSEAEQAMTEEELVESLPGFDGWIIGDDPVNETVLRAGVGGRLRAAVRWGIGMDNVDALAAEALGLEIENTPCVFGEEVADVALGYVIGLARDLFSVDRSVRRGSWPKPTGSSLRGKRALVVGYGDVGRALTLRLNALGLILDVADPYANPEQFPEFITQTRLDDSIPHVDFLILCCPLTSETLRLVDAQIFEKMKAEACIVNVSRGQLIDENALIKALAEKRIRAAALDVFETEPLGLDSALRRFDNVVMGCHNSSNTIEAIDRASQKALQTLHDKFGMGFQRLSRTSSDETAS